LSGDGTLDTSFDPGSGSPNGIVLGLAVQPDGKLLIGGVFTSYDGTARNRIARINADGSLDTSFDPGIGPNSYVREMAVQPDGKILIAGAFASYSGTARSKIARINADGSLDTSFDPGGGITAGGFVVSFALQPDDKILIAGGFTEYDGVSANRIVRINADGSRDNTFGGTGANNGVNATLLQPDGKILIVGGFTEYSGTVRNGMARINADGSLDTTFDPGSGGYGLYDMELRSDGKIMISGGFSSYDGVAFKRIARINADGSLDTSFDPGDGADTYIDTIALQADGKTVIGGRFTTFDGTGRNYIGRVNEDGSLDTSFDPGDGASARVQALAILSNGQIMTGGEFTSYDGTPANYLARIEGANAGITLVDAFSFTDQNNAAVSTQIESNIVQINGIEPACFASVATAISGD